MGILIVVLTFLGLGVFLYAAIVFPVLMLVNCAKRSDRSGGYRAGWIVGMVLLFPFVSYLYGIWQAERVRTKVMAGLLIVFWIAIFIFMVYALRIVKQITIDAIPGLQTLVTQSSLEEAGKQNMISATNTLEREIQTLSVLSATSRNDMELISLLQDFLSDKQLTQSEAQEWLNFFNVRESLDVEALKDRRSQIA